MKSDRLETLTDALRAAQRIALIVHVSPDGDTCGSALALRRALILLGKQVTVVCDHPLPHIYDDLEGGDALLTPDTQAGLTFDLSVAIDVADRARMGASIAVFDAGRRTAQVDHHLTNPGYAQINYLRSPLSATGVLILEIIDALGVPLDEAIAKCIFVAVITDTGNFRQQNTDPAAMLVGARCLETGLNPEEITRRVFDMRPVQQIKLMARALESLALYENGALALMRLTRADFQETGALPEHTEGIIRFGINTEGVKMACLLSQPMERVKGSLRSVPPYDVSRVATALGGGGHTVAAGCLVEMSMQEAADRMLDEMKKELDRNA